jgi:hypothetical protein
MDALDVQVVLEESQHILLLDLFQLHGLGLSLKLEKLVVLFSLTPVDGFL